MSPSFSSLRRRSSPSPSLVAWALRSGGGSCGALARCRGERRRRPCYREGPSWGAFCRNPTVVSVTCSLVPVVVAVCCAVRCQQCEL
ncbi:hypothetical protein Taro_048627 [Colocasia esculenta]|uniref:Uncharacterized protein n=1 Tax=Colocasia esculenta TaxID=4460 RepID=A0A843X8M6_COLES|nr:hypothetical protein [Colocasia esculenta]